MYVWLNGEFVDHDSASVPVFDAGFQHGVGLFETMSARNGRVFRAEAHMHRLIESARALLLSDRLRAAPLIEAVNHTVQRNELEAARVRLTVTGGNLNRLQSEGKGQVDPAILIVTQPPTVYPPAFFAEGVTTIIADGRDNPFDPMAGHKTLNYWPRIHALQSAASKKAGEAIWFTVSNHVASGSVSNIFVVKDGELHTPIARGEEVKQALGSSVLPGITRAAIIEIAESMDIQTTKRLLDINELLAADEVFLTNSSWGVLPVVGVEREKIAEGKVGELTHQLRNAWSELVDRETSLASG